MKIQYCSDLHLEFIRNAKYLKYKQIIPVADLLILAGDVTYFEDYYFKHEFFDYLSDSFKQVYMIAGNHEFYCGREANIQLKPFTFVIRKNVLLVNNQSIHIQDINFIFTTLWSKIDIKYALKIEQSVSDFELIRYNNKKLTAETFNLLFESSFKFLQQTIKSNTSNKIVVATHHLPSNLCNAAEFHGSSLNSAFCVDLTDFILQNKIDYWVYGHSHRNKPEIKLGHTKLVTNQLGYIDSNEHFDFKFDAYFEI